MQLLIDSSQDPPAIANLHKVEGQHDFSNKKLIPL
uniref:Uncharacterized protein n=1 Tax=Arundo donax TaxID=35708 RepID=A0A0A8Z0Q6_ARUDO